MHPIVKELKTYVSSSGPCIKFGRRALPLSRPRLLHNVDTVGNKMGSKVSVKVSSGDEENLPLPIPGNKLRDYTEMAYMTGRAKVVNDYFPTAIGIDDFLHRLEIALYAYGFSGDNAIGMFSALTSCWPCKICIFSDCKTRKSINYKADNYVAQLW